MQCRHNYSTTRTKDVQSKFFATYQVQRSVCLPLSTAAVSAPVFLLFAFLRNYDSQHVCFPVFKPRVAMTGVRSTGLPMSDQYVKLEEERRQKERAEKERIELERLARERQRAEKEKKTGGCTPLTSWLCIRYLCLLSHGLK